MNESRWKYFTIERLAISDPFIISIHNNWIFLLYMRVSVCLCLTVCVCGNFNDNWFELISCKPGGRISKVADFYVILKTNITYSFIKPVETDNDREQPGRYFLCSLFHFHFFLSFIRCRKKKRNLIEKYYKLWTRLINRYFCMLNNLISSSSSSTTQQQQ